MQTTLDIAKEVGSVIWKYHTKQSCKVQGVIVFNNTFTTGGTVEPKTRPLDVCMRTVAQGRTYDSLSTSTGVLIFLCHITQKATSKLFNIKLAFKEDKLTMREHYKRDMRQLTHIHTARSRQT